VLAGCSANHNTAFRHQSITGSSVTLIDAKQRAIYSRFAGSGNAEIQRFCAEPSPDVFSVVAQAFSGGVNFGKTADPKALEVALNAAFNSAEQGSTIPRTQTINMLREMMFRTCERYLSGGINELELPLQAIRDQRLMVSILAIEQLTGAVTAKPVVIGASASGSSGSSGAEAALRLDDLQKDLQAKKTAEGKKQAAYDELNGESKDCQAIATAVAGNKADGLSEALKTKRPKCEAASSELAKAKTDRTEAATHYAKIAEVASAGGIPVSVNTALMTPVAGGGLDRAHSSDVAEVAAAVRAIVSDTFDQDEFLFMCLKIIGGSSDKASTIQDNCVSYIKSKVDLQKARNESERTEIEAMQSKIQQHVGELFDQFWALVKTADDQIDASKLKALKPKIAHWPACLDASKTKSDAKKCFDGARAQQRRDLAKGSSSNV
jgi:hypothetical protein